ncbi:hypothetical protein SDC9_164475 [bioreactor metagenome]|uniref:Uncharacterized protein n=1 Tax=bioreactor metagenome TaxID=1076179 RepID=A0A645FRQ4_9ZZZZ
MLKSMDNLTSILNNEKIKITAAGNRVIKLILKIFDISVFILF